MYGFSLFGGLVEVNCTSILQNDMFLALSHNSYVSTVDLQRIVPEILYLDNGVLEGKVDIAVATLPRNMSTLPAMKTVNQSWNSEAMQKAIDAVKKDGLP
ncbi:hypothetical protein J6590_105123 [Homalodisca vitripennis]|nr:hypothetical protein J6590_105123 [Homalodisca vitripennis]